MTAFRLTRRAEQSLETIFGWTLDTFGSAQAERYRDQLIARLNHLAAGTPPHGRPCGLLVGDRVGTSGLNCYREGCHYIIYRRIADELVVIDVVHGTRDLPAVIEALSREPRS